MTKIQLKEEIKPFFPYEDLRDKQGKAINEIFSELNSTRKHIVVSAPNGYGKTILSLSAILPIIKEKKKKLIYLCRTHTQVQRVIEELSKIESNINRNELDIKIGGLGLRGRNAMCFHPVVLKLTDPTSAHLTCRELRTSNRCLFFNNIKRKTERVDFLLSILQTSPMDGSQLIEICKDYDLCPYMISKLALSHVDVIACNFQWILNPYIRKNFLETLDTSLKDIILVIDEAHNVPNIATDISSITLTKYGVEICIDEILEYKKRNYLAFGKCVKEIFDDLLKKDFEELAIIPKYIIRKIKNKCVINEQFCEKMIDTGKEIRNIKIKKQQTPQSSIYSFGNFWLKWLQSMKKDSYFFVATKYRTRKQNESIKLEIVSLDPRELLKDIFNNVEGSLHMSGTINPAAYIDIVGLPDSTLQLNLPALWKDKNLRVLAIKGITSKGSHRSLGMYKQMLNLISVAIKCTPKNIGVFTASYDILNGLIQAGFKKIKTKKKIYIEKSGKSSKENDIMIKKFKNDSKTNGGILLGVCGGRNAEGEDFPGDFMNTAVICGIPFARPTVRIQALIDYYVKKWGKNKGKDLSYNIPALRRANQAAGRPIRTLTDKGIIILLDYRYTMSYFNRFLANWLKDKINVLENDPELIKTELKAFYGNK